LMGADLFSLYITSYKRGANVVIKFKSKKSKLKIVFDRQFAVMMIIS